MRMLEAAVASLLLFTASTTASSQQVTQQQQHQQQYKTLSSCSPIPSNPPEILPKTFQAGPEICIALHCSGWS